MATNGTHATNGIGSPEIILYTNHGCPWAHRAHIVIKELGLPYKEEIIDLDRPRDPWYLKVNPVSWPQLSLHGPTFSRCELVILISSLQARPRSQHQLQWRNHYGVPGCLAISRRCAPVTFDSTINWGRKRSIPCSCELLRRYIYYQGAASNLCRLASTERC